MPATTANPRSEPPFSGERRLYNVVEAQFRTNFLKHDFDARELQLRLGDQVIVETDRGPAIAEVTSHVHRAVRDVDSLDRVLRKANASDIRRTAKNEQLERNAYKFCLERIRARNLKMKLVRVQYMHDGSKIVFFFSADGRIDFRDLVKDLAHRYRTRIEMHQIGVRDGTRMLGGIGPCGRELCCSTFLENFSPVSIRMAKKQGLTLNPAKVSGMCGRLMCCLVYEQKLYKQMRRSLPRAGQKARTERGTGEIVDLDVINRRVNVRFPDETTENFDVDEIEVVGKRRVRETVDSERRQSDTYLWTDDDPARVAFVRITERRFSRRIRSSLRADSEESDS
ncbi:MAG: PSP1 domain-containing protein [Myxococcota bacterium]